MNALGAALLVRIETDGVCSVFFDLLFHLILYFRIERPGGCVCRAIIKVVHDGLIVLKYSIEALQSHFPDLVPCQPSHQWWPVISLETQSVERKNIIWWYSCRSTGMESAPMSDERPLQACFSVQRICGNLKNIPLRVALEVAVKVRRLFSKSPGGSFCTHLSASVAGVPDGYIAL